MYTYDTHRKKSNHNRSFKLRIRTCLRDLLQHLLSVVVLPVIAKLRKRLLHSSLDFHSLKFFYYILDYDKRSWNYLWSTPFVMVTYMSLWLLCCIFPSLCISIKLLYLIFPCCRTQLFFFSCEGYDIISAIGCCIWAIPKDSPLFFFFLIRITKESV